MALTGQEPDVTAQQNPGTRADDELIRLINSGYGVGSTNGRDNEVRAYIDRYISNLDPNQLLARYGGINQGGGIENYYQQNYGVGAPREIKDAGNYQAYQSFQSMMGRPPTSEEFAQIVPIFQQADGQKYGNAWLAQYKQQYDADPRNRLKDAPRFSESINQQFQSMLGRGATQDEINHFGSLMATGNVDAYQLQDFLRGTTEYQQGQDKQFRSGLSKELEDSDVRYFDRAKQGVLSQFMQNGTMGSSALDSALADLMGQIAEKRQGFLSQVSSQQYGANKDLAIGNYNNARNDYFGEQAYKRGQASKQQDYYQGRSDNLTDYNRQQQDYMNYLNSQGGRRKAPWGQIAGGAIGGGIGAFMGGPTGAAAGYQIGSGVGGGYDYLNY